MAELAELARSVAEQANGGKGEQVEAYVARARETSVRVYEGDVEHLSSADSAGVGVRVVRDGRIGFAWVGALGEESAAEALREARDNASYATVDEHAGLAEPDGVEPAALDLWREALGGTPTDAKIDLALDLERRVRQGDRRIRQVVKTDYADAMSETAVATSTGICAASSRSNCFIASYAIAGDSDETQTGFGYSVGRSVEDLDVTKAAGDAVERATRLLGAEKPPSSRLTALLDPRVTATLLSILAGTLSGEEVAKGRSLFANRIGEEVGVAGLTLVDDPTDAAAYGATPTDAEGLACRRNRLIDGGKLLGYMYDTHAARVAGTASTASAVRGGYRTTPRAGRGPSPSSRATSARPR